MSWSWFKQINFRPSIFLKGVLFLVIRGKSCESEVVVSLQRSDPIQVKKVGIMVVQSGIEFCGVFRLMPWVQSESLVKD